MPEKHTIERARRAKRQGKRPTTQAGEFVREEIEHVRHGKHGVRSPRQAIAIGLAKARRAGVDLPPPGPGKANAKTRKSAASAYRRGQKQGTLARSPGGPSSTRRTSKRSTSMRRASS